MSIYDLVGKEFCKKSGPKPPCVEIPLKFIRDVNIATSFNSFPTLSLNIIVVPEIQQEVVDKIFRGMRKKKIGMQGGESNA